MIKKAANISLIILLLFSTMGVTMYKHYCGSALIKESIGVLPHDCCKGHCNACHNEAKQFKITDSFEATDANFNFKNEITKIFGQTHFAIIFLVSTFQDYIPNNFFFKVKSCEKLLSTVGNSSALLQVFRL